MAKKSRKGKSKAKAVVAATKLPALPKLPKVDKKKVLIGLGVVAAVALLYFFKGLFVAAIVNGHPISRIAVIRELEKQDGTSVLNSMVTKELIAEEASKNKVTVSNDEINAEVAKVESSIKAQGQTLDQALATQGWTRADLEDQIKTQLTVEKILKDKVTVTDKEVDDYIKANKSTDTRQNIADQLRQQKLMTEYQTWIQGLMAKASVKFWVSY